MNDNLLTFDALTPDVVFNAIEENYPLVLNGVITAYKSYVNRVKGVETDENERLIVKFYRPGRWALEAITEEHQFIYDCSENEVPAVAPIINNDGSPVSEYQGIYFALFPFKAGRLFEIKSDEDWIRLGREIGRIHRIGMARDAKNRVVYTPLESTTQYIEILLDGDIIPSHLQHPFRLLCEETLNIISPLFEGIDLHRIHGDLHQANILDRADEGLMLVDFDDMMVGPAVQDLWLLLPDHYRGSLVEMDLLLEGYRQFNRFDNRQLKLIEPLRFMRMIYFLSWCAMQLDDPAFLSNFPGWGTEEFWETEIEDLRGQLEQIEEHLEDGF